jgi:hypothetical protein
LIKALGLATVSTPTIADEMTVTVLASTLPCDPAFAACTVTLPLVTVAGITYALSVALNKGCVLSAITTNDCVPSDVATVEPTAIVAALVGVNREKITVPLA